MKQVSGSQQLGVRLTPELLRLVDDVASVRCCDRPEAIRHLIQVAAPLVLKSKSINIERLLTGLEILVIDCLRKASETNPDDVDMLVKAASTNVETYHV
ncbi:hypothetical protein [Novosphingobium sp. AP12]|uniref:hypothetical protein n=1 Tax=Novosphingobium sp. AP12 TaxID=1144305 RepID=UPI000271FBB2|nr:hypothetical protein [Novosphingobium sp. AP12]EJL22828.1 hypothetical protein PMI02_04413 [Novosphingobium sp. AP12]